MIDLVVLHIRPVGHIKLLVDSEAPLVSVGANAALVSLRTHVLSVQSVALRVSVQQLLSFHCFSISVCANDALAETRRCIRHGALAQNLNVVLSGSALLIDDLAFLIWVSRNAIVGRIGLFSIELDHRGFSALSLILSRLECESRLAVPAVRSVLLQCGTSICLNLVPPEFDACALTVQLHAPLCVGLTVLFGAVPAVVADATLVVLCANLTVLAIWTTH